MVEDLAPVVLALIPIVAIIGGITSGIVRTLSRQRMIELAQRERIAAIERGIDPAKLPPLPSIDAEEIFGTSEQRAKRRSQGLMIGGIVMVAMASALMAMMVIMEPHENHWAIGILPAAIGIALLLSAWLVRPRDESGGASKM
jgi:hypothetical protein